MSVNMMCGKCGYESAIETFSRTQQPKTYQCPRCRRRETIVDEKPTVMPNGFIMPGKRKVVIS